MQSSTLRGNKLPDHWTCVNNSLLIFNNNPRLIANKETSGEEEKIKFAGFDFDDTLVRKHGNNLSFPTVLDKLRDLFEEGFHLIIFSNETLDHLKSQSAIASTIKKKIERLDRFVKDLEVPIQIFVATKYDEYRKPSTKDRAKNKPGGDLMWKTMLEINGVRPTQIDMDYSFYVGDASGKPGEFSDADLQFANCIGLKFIHAKDFFSKDRKQMFNNKTVLSDLHQGKQDQDKEQEEERERPISAGKVSVYPKSKRTKFEKEDEGTDVQVQEYAALEEFAINRKRVQNFED